MTAYITLKSRCWVSLPFEGLRGVWKLDRGKLLIWKVCAKETLFDAGGVMMPLGDGIHHHEVLLLEIADIGRAQSGLEK